MLEHTQCASLIYSDRSKSEYRGSKIIIMNGPGPAEDTLEWEGRAQGRAGTTSLGGINQYKCTYFHANEPTLLLLLAAGYVLRG